MKKLVILFGIQAFVGLCLAPVAQAQEPGLRMAVAATSAEQHYIAALSSLAAPAAYGPLWVVAMSQPPLTLPALANYEVGRQAHQRPARDHGAACRPVYEVELWHVVPKTLLFSRNGSLLATPGS